MIVSFDRAELEGFAGVGRRLARVGGLDRPTVCPRSSSAAAAVQRCSSVCTAARSLGQQVEAREEQALLRGREDPGLVRTVERDDVGSRRRRAAVGLGDESELHPPTAKRSARRPRARPRRRAPPAETDAVFTATSSWLLRP